MSKATYMLVEFEIHEPTHTLPAGEDPEWHWRAYEYAIPYGIAEDMAMQCIYFGISPNEVLLKFMPQRDYIVETGERIEGGCWNWSGITYRGESTLRAFVHQAYNELREAGLRAGNILHQHGAQAGNAAQKAQQP